MRPGVARVPSRRCRNELRQGCHVSQAVGMSGGCVCGVGGADGGRGFFTASRCGSRNWRCTFVDAHVILVYISTIVPTYLEESMSCIPIMLPTIAVLSLPDLPYHSQFYFFSELPGSGFHLIFPGIPVMPCLVLPFYAAHGSRAVLS